MALNVGDPITGNDGLATIASTEFQILAWSLNRTATPRDVSDGDNTAIKRVPAKYVDTSGSVSLLLKAGTALPSINTDVSLRLDLDNTTGIYYSGRAIFTSQPIQLDHKGTEGIIVQMDFAANGDLALTDGSEPAV